MKSIYTTPEGGKMGEGKKKNPEVSTEGVKIYK